MPIFLTLDPDPDRDHICICIYWHVYEPIGFPYFMAISFFFFLGFILILQSRALD